MSLPDNYQPTTHLESLLYALYQEQCKTNELLEKLVPKEQPNVDEIPAESTPAALDKAPAEKPKRQRKGGTL